MRITTALKADYPEFLEFCAARKIRKTEQITENLYAAYRSETGSTEECTNAIKAKIRMAEADPDCMVCETLDVEPLPEYRRIPAEAIGCSTRARHLFRNVGIKSLYDLLTSVNAVFRDKDSIGARTLRDIYDKTADFIESGDAARYPGPYIGKVKDKAVPEPVWIPLDDTDLAAEPLDTDLETLDNELKELASGHPESFSLLSKGLAAHYRPAFEYYRSVRDMVDSCRNLPDYIRNCPAGELLAAYSLRFPDEAKQLGVWPQDKTVPAILLSAAHEDPADWIKAASAFCSWLQGLDLAKACGYVFCKERIEETNKAEKAAKCWDIVLRRTGGDTLDGIGALYGTTRERIRQLEASALGSLAVAYFKSPYEIMALIHIRTGICMLSYRQAEALIGRTEARLFWMLAEKHMLDCGMYEYSKDLKAVCWNAVTGTPDDLQLIAEAVQSLPETFYEDEKPAIFRETAERRGVPAKILEEWLARRYKKYGRLYSAVKPDMATKCEYLLRECFKDGYKVGNPDMADKALGILSGTFGGKINTSQHLLDYRISGPGLLIDRGLYMYPGYVHLDESAIDGILADVFAYVEQSASGTISYTELYNVFKDRLEAAGVSNRYMLSGVIKRRGCPYMTTRDYIMKGEDSSMAAELSAFAKKKGRFTFKEFADAFPYYNPTLLYPLVSRTDDVIQIGPARFMDATRLEYTHKDDKDILSFINRHMTPSGMDTDAVFPEFRMTFSQFCGRNVINRAQDLFSVLEYMYRDYFVFSRPVILPMD